MKNKSLTYRAIANYAQREDIVVSHQYGGLTFDIVDAVAVRKRYGDTTSTKMPYVAALRFGGVLLDTAMLPDTLQDRKSKAFHLSYVLIARCYIRLLVNRYVTESLDTAEHASFFYYAYDLLAHIRGNIEEREYDTSTRTLPPNKRLPALLFEILEKFSLIKYSLRCGTQSVMVTRHLSYVSASRCPQVMTRMHFFMDNTSHHLDRTGYSMTRDVSETIYQPIESISTDEDILRYARSCYDEFNDRTALDALTNGHNQTRKHGTIQ